MSLALKIMNLYPSLKQHDFLDQSMIILQNDGDGDYIKKWNHPTLAEPIYDAVNNVVYAPQPFPSWVLDQVTWLWSAPVPYPDDGQRYDWDEATVSWKPVT